MSTEKNTHTPGPTLVVSQRDLDAPGNAPYIHAVDVIHAVAPHHPVYATAYGNTPEGARARADMIAMCAVNPEAVGEVMELFGQLYKQALAISDLRHNGAEIDDEEWSNLYNLCMDSRAALLKAGVK